MKLLRWATIKGPVSMNVLNALRKLGYCVKYSRHYDEALILEATKGIK